MKKEVLAYIKQNKMIKKKDMILAGVSGGSDSMAMLHILRELQEEVDFSLKVVHVHHGIRGQEADRDSSFVEKICKEWQIPCSIHYYDVPKLSREWKLGEEETGRIVRKEAFGKEISFYREKWKKENNPGNDTEDRKVKIALAHNQEDLAETMIHNLCRGTGLRGLCTMRPAAEDIIRPILCLSRSQIRDFLQEKGISCIQDSTNQSDEYTRNRIRHHILPELETQVNKKASAHMVETASRLALAEDYLSEQGKTLLKAFVGDRQYCFTEEFFHRPKILQIYALQQAVEDLAGRRKDISAVHYEKILNLWQMQTGRKISLPYGITAGRTYGAVLLYQKPETDETSGKNAEETQLIIPGDTICACGRIQAEIFSYTGQKIEEKKYTKWLDYDRIEKNPCVRTRKEGDFLIINSRGDRKKLRRCMIDEKIPSEERDKIPVIACGDEILWIVGSRISERYKITPKTRKVLVLKYQGGHKNE